MSFLIVAILVVFGLAALLTLVRIVRGPSTLDRAVASDVLITEVICVMGLEMVLHEHTRTLPALLILAAIGAFGSISVARFLARREEEER